MLSATILLSTLGPSWKVYATVMAFALQFSSNMQAADKTAWMQTALTCYSYETVSSHFLCTVLPWKQDSDIQFPKQIRI